jgi:hypothetical protein
VLRGSNQHREVWSNKTLKQPELDRVVFVLPNDIEACLAACAAIQRYAFGHAFRAKNELSAKNLEINYVACSDRIMWLKRHFPPGNWSNWKSYPPRGEYELVHIFDPVVAYELSKASWRPMANVFSVQIGADADSLPELEKPLMPPLYDIVFSKSLHPDVVEQVMAELGGQLTICYGSPQELWQIPKFATMGKLFVGYRSPETYYAAASGIAVFELYPDDYHRRWLSKWAARNYRMYYGHTFKTELIVRGVKALWQQLSSLSMNQQGLVSGTSTEQSISVVNSAVKSLPESAVK